MGDDTHPEDAGDTDSHTRPLEALALRLIRRARAIRVLRFAGIVGAYGAAIMAALLLSLVLGLLSIDPWSLLASYGAALLTAALIAVVLFRKSRARALLDADRAYGTEELLSTAYGELRRRPTSPFTRSIGRQAARVAAEVIPSRVYSAKPVRPAAIPAVLFLVALSAVAMGWIAPATTVPVQNRNAAQMLEELGSRLAAEAQGENSSTTRELARDLEELGDQMSGQGLDKEERDRARRMLPRIEEQVDSLSRSSLPEANRQSEQLANAQDLVKGLLRQGGENMTELNVASAGRTGGTMSTDRNGTSPGSGSGDGEATEADGARAEAPDRSGSGSANEPGASRQGMSSLPYDGQAGQREPGDQGGDGSARLDRGRGGAPGSSGSPSAGSAQPGNSPGGGAGAGTAPDQSGSGEEGEQQLEPRSSEGAASRLDGELGDGEVMRLYVRKLAERAESELPNREITEQYQSAVESAVGRQQVPPRAERLVRDYFVLLGVSERDRREDGGSE